jgi:hypothetical protein
MASTDDMDLFSAFHIFSRESLQNPFKDVVTEEHPSPTRLSTFYRYVYNALRGFDDENEPRTQVWYKIPRRKKAGLLDYIFTMPGQVLGGILVVGGAIAGCLAVDLFLLWLISQAGGRGAHPFFTGMFFGYLLAGGGQGGLGLFFLGLAAIGGLIAYGLVVYPGLLLVTRVAVPVLSVALAGLAAPVLWLTQRMGLINVVDATEEAQLNRALEGAERERSEQLRPTPGSTQGIIVTTTPTVSSSMPPTSFFPTYPTYDAPPSYDQVEAEKQQAARAAQQRAPVNNSEDVIGHIARELPQQSAVVLPRRPPLTPTAPPAPAPAEEKREEKTTQAASSQRPSSLWRRSNQHPINDSVAANTSSGYGKRSVGSGK